MASRAEIRIKTPADESHGLTSHLSHEAIAQISGSLRHRLADVFALYVKTKNFHWHTTGRNFRDYHLSVKSAPSQEKSK